MILNFHLESDSGHRPQHPIECCVLSFGQHRTQYDNVIISETQPGQTSPLLLFYYFELVLEPDTGPTVPAGVYSLQ